jgi:hypothetical protein
VRVPWRGGTTKPSSRRAPPPLNSHFTGAPWTSELRYDKSLVDERPPQHLLTAYLEDIRKK